MQLRTLPAALLATGTLLALVSASPLAAQTAVTVTNPSFEDPAIADGAVTTGLNDWTSLGNTGIGLTTNIQTLNPTNAQYTGASNGGSGLFGLLGNQVASFRTQALVLNLATLGGTATQQSGGLLTLGTTYRLTVAVGFPKDVDIFQGYTVSIFSAGASLPTTVLASVTQDTGGVPARGTFQDVSFDYQLPALSGLANTPLFVSLSVPGGVPLLGSGGLGLGQSSGTDFDNVRLTATPIIVPEPSTIASACVGLLGLVGIQYARRRRGSAAPLCA